MFLHLVVPGLVWPKAGVAGLTRDLNLPTLERLLAHARVRAAMPAALENWLATAFGIAGEAPHAALRRLGEADGDTAAQHDQWLCADPTHLHFAREHLLLTDATDLAISGEDAHQLVEALNAHLAEFEPDVGHIEVATPTRWYLRLEAPPRARFAPLSDVVGRPIKHYLPEGEAAARWQRLINEFQVVLHNHPVNSAREAAGLRPINNLWLWGAGTLSGPLQAPARVVQAASPFADGLVRAAGLHPQSPHPLPDADAMVVLEGLRHATLYLDLDRWRDALAQLENAWFAPVLAALKSRHLTELRISAPGDRGTLELDVSASELWKFWRRPRTLDTILSTIP